MTFSFLAFLACVFAWGIPAIAAVQTTDALVFSGRAGDYFHPQGNCTIPVGNTPVNGICPQRNVSGTDLCISTWSCHGASKNMLHATYRSGVNLCVYLDNSSTDLNQAYFVPLNTSEEWQAFSNTGNTPPDVKIVVGCPGGVKTDECGNKYTLPDVRVSDDPDDVQRVVISPDYSLDYFCPATIKTKDKDGIETAQPVVNCGDWVITRHGACAMEAALSFKGAVCAKQTRGVEFVMVLDASSSMDQLLAGAQNALRGLASKYLVPRSDIPVTITVIGGKNYSDRLDDPSKPNCPYGRLFGPLASNATQINSALGTVIADNNTPIDTTLRYSAEFFKDTSNRRVMLVLSDGYETCFGDPAYATQQLRDKGIEIYGIKYGNGGDADVLKFFQAMNTYSLANSQDQIIAAIENVVKDITDKSCKATLYLYKPGDSDGDPLYTILSDQNVKVKHGIYDAVVDYCTGTQVFRDQKIETDRGFDFTCPK